LKPLRIIRSVNPEGGVPIEGIKQFVKPLRDEGHDVEIVSLDVDDADFVKLCPIHALGPALGKCGYSRN
jgi:hypothetical protein